MVIEFRGVVLVMAFGGFGLVAQSFLDWLWVCGWYGCFWASVLFCWFIVFGWFFGGFFGSMRVLFASCFILGLVVGVVGFFVVWLFFWFGLVLSFVFFFGFLVFCVLVILFFLGCIWVFVCFFVVVFVFYGC